MPIPQKKSGWRASTHVKMSVLNHVWETVLLSVPTLVLVTAMTCVLIHVTKFVKEVANSIVQ